MAASNCGSVGKGKLLWRESERPVQEPAESLRKATIAATSSTAAFALVSGARVD